MLAADTGGPARSRFGFRADDDDGYVAIDPDAHEALVAHCRANADREVGGVLIGSAHAGGTTVSAALPALRAQERRARLTFTHDTWNQVFEAVDARWPDHEIVGWYHSHPDFGVFLSGHDVFIQRSFFPAAHHLAHVVDPVRGEEGVFGWRDGDVVELATRPAPGVE